MFGAVSTARERVLVPITGVTFVGSVFPVARTLGSLQVENMTGFEKNSGTLTAADKVVLFDGATWHSYNYNLAAGHWREGAATFNKDTLAIPFGAPFYIERGSGAHGSPGLVSFDPPYTL